MAAAMINLKGWLVFSEPNAPCRPVVEWKEPTAAFLKAWKTTAIPVIVRRVRSHKMDIRIEFSDRDGGWYKVMKGRRCLQDFRDPKEAETFRRAQVRKGV